MLKSFLWQGWNKTPRQMFSSEYCDISTNTSFEEYLGTAASENNKQRFLGKTTGHNDHYMINMSNQRPKTDGNWLFTGLYLQCCKDIAILKRLVNVLGKYGLYFHCCKDIAILKRLVNVLGKYLWWSPWICQLQSCFSQTFSWNITKF